MKNKILFASICVSILLLTSGCAAKGGSGSSEPTSTSAAETTETSATTSVSVSQSSGDDASNSGAPVEDAGPLAKTIEEIYKKTDPGLMLDPPTKVDLTDSYKAKYFLGIKDPADIEDAVYSETAIGAQAYSLCLAQIKEGADVEKIKNEMFEGIDTRKWICAVADRLIVANHENTVILVMVDRKLSETLADDLVKSFDEVTGGIGEKLERTAS